MHLALFGCQTSSDSSSERLRLSLGPAVDRRDATLQEKTPQQTTRITREPALLVDTEYSTRERIEIDRIVYRMTFSPTAVLHATAVRNRADDRAPTAIAELKIDLSADRLRAYFVGLGWPVESDSEVRMRRDMPGAYLVDSRGGQRLSTGELHHWFTGDTGTSAGSSCLAPSAYSRAAPSDHMVTGSVLCRFLSEWSGPQPGAHFCRHKNQPNDASTTRFVPHRFKVGSWMGRRTALLKLELEKRFLRSDHLGTNHQLNGAKEAKGLRGPTSKPRRQDNSSLFLRIRNTYPCRIGILVASKGLSWLPSGAERLFFFDASPPIEKARVTVLHSLGNVLHEYRNVSLPAILTVP